MSKALLSEEKIKELSKTVQADEVSFLNYFKIFQTLYDTHPPTQYANYFHCTSLFDLEKVNKINNNDSFLKAIATFINEVTFSKKKIFIEFSTEDSVANAIKVLKMLKDPKKYLYCLHMARPKVADIDFIKFVEIFEYIDNIEDVHFFEDCAKKIIEDKINVGKLYYVNLDQIPVDKVIEYSTQYPNKIKELYAFENKEYDKIKKVCDLNSETLIRIPNCKLDLYPNLKNVEIVTINSEPLPDPLPDNFNYSSVKNLETIFIEDDSEEKTNFAIELMNKCPNLEKVSFATFSELTQEQFLKIFSTTKSKKIKEICVTCQEFEEGIDFAPIFKNLPKLSKFRVDCHCSMDFLYALHPIISCEKVAPTYPILEQLINNYLNEDEDNYLKGEFPNDFEPFFEYFKKKENIMNRFEKIWGDSASTFELPYFSHLIINKSAEIAKFNVKKVGTVHVLCPVDDKIKQFLEKVKPDFIKVKEGKLDDSVSNATKIVYCADTGDMKF